MYDHRLEGLEFTSSALPVVVTYSLRGTTDSSLKRINAEFGSVLR